MNIVKLQETFERYCGEFCTELPKEPVHLYEPVRYALSSGGKRVRPVLCLLAASVYHDDVTCALPSAMAIELFHNFSLLHDDIMDNAPMRRGNPTVRAKWNDNIAILSGDALFAESFRILGRSDQAVLPSLLQVFTHTSLKVCEGQQWDMDFESRNDVSIKQYLDMIECKTAALIGAALQMGAMAAGATGPDAEKFYLFGKHAGIAFQLQDDILDSFGDEGKTGKRNGGDIISNKKTFLLLKAFELATRGQQEELFALMQVKDEKEKIGGVMSLYRQLEVRRYAEQEMRKHFDHAFEASDGMKANGARLETLKDFVRQLMKRES